MAQLDVCDTSDIYRCAHIETPRGKYKIYIDIFTDENIQLLSNIYTFISKLKILELVKHAENIII